MSVSEKYAYDSTPKQKGVALGIREWLEGLGLGEYSGKFEDEAVSLDTLRESEMTDTDLREIGVGKLGHRKKILTAIEDLRKTHRSSSGGQAAPPATTSAPVSAPPLPATTAASLASVMISDVEIGEALGAGAFGVVFRALWHGNAVAAKSVASLAADDHEFFAEAETCMKARHPNCVMFYGIFRRPSDGVLFMVSELMPLGSLESWLRAQPSLPPAPVLLRLLRDASAGMIYLSSLGLVHRDIAARNCLLKEEHPSGAESSGSSGERELVAKIGDYGMSRAAGPGGDYSAHSGLMPACWSALESLTSRKFSSKSDCWSFGVLCWEVFSKAAKPFEGIDRGNLIEFLRSGKRLEKPSACPPELYSLMSETWLEDPAARPDFKSIHERLCMMLAECPKPQRPAPKRITLVSLVLLHCSNCSKAKSGLCPVHDKLPVLSGGTKAMTRADFDALKLPPGAGIGGIVYELLIFAHVFIESGRFTARLTSFAEASGKLSLRLEAGYPLPLQKEHDGGLLENIAPFSCDFHFSAIVSTLSGYVDGAGCDGCGIGMEQDSVWWHCFSCRDFDFCCACFAKNRGKDFGRHQCDHSGDFVTCATSVEFKNVGVLPWNWFAVGSSAGGSQEFLAVHEGDPKVIFHSIPISKNRVGLSGIEVLIGGESLTAKLVKKIQLQKELVVKTREKMQKK